MKVVVSVYFAKGKTVSKVEYLKIEKKFKTFRQIRNAIKKEIKLRNQESDIPIHSYKFSIDTKYRKITKKCK